MSSFEVFFQLFSTSLRPRLEFLRLATAIASVHGVFKRALTRQSPREVFLVHVWVSSFDHPTWSLLYPSKHLEELFDLVPLCLVKFLFEDCEVYFVVASANSFIYRCSFEDKSWWISSSAQNCLNF